MAIDVRDEYGSSVNEKDEKYPFGSFKNETVAGAGDGSYVDEAHGNDVLGFLQKLLVEAGITPSGKPDNIIASDQEHGQHHQFGGW